MSFYQVVVAALFVALTVGACGVGPERTEKLNPKNIKISGKNQQCFWSIHRSVGKQNKLTAYVCGSIGKEVSRFDLYLFDKNFADAKLLKKKWQEIRSAAELSYVTDLGYRETGTLFLHTKSPNYYLGVEQALKNTQLRVENDLKVTRLF